MKTNECFRRKLLSKDGFTLIELLSVIILIVGIMLIVLPKITGSVKNKELAINTSYENIIFKALDLYISDNSSKYPKATTNTYCVAVDTLKKKGYLKDYNNDNIKTKNIVKVTYSGGYHYEMVDECTEQITDYDKCTEEGKCSACMVLSEYNTLKEVYKYTPKIVKDVKYNDANLVNGTDITIVRNNDECVKEAIISAAKDHVVSNPKVYKKNKNNIYCISVESLINEGRLESNLVYLNKSITNYSVKVTYTGRFNYDLLESNSCKEKIVYQDEILNGNDPSLDGGLVPVLYDSADKVWRVADISKKWYDYENQWWANAVVLKKGVTKNVGDAVNIECSNYSSSDYCTETEDIIGIYVWIPRYSYTIGNTYGVKLDGANDVSQSYPGAIDIEFTDIEDIRNGNASYTGSLKANYRTHPAFTFGDKELTGFWMGKFETSFDTVYLNDLYVLANNRIYGNYNVNSYHHRASQIVTSSDLDSNIVDSHFSKNSEWGAMAYLSQSKYGKYGNVNYTGDNKIIYRNNNFSTNIYSGRSAGYQKNDYYMDNYPYYRYFYDKFSIPECQDKTAGVAISLKKTADSNWQESSSKYTAVSKKAGNSDKLTFNFNSSEDINLSFSYGIGLSNGSNSISYSISGKSYSGKSISISSKVSAIINKSSSASVHKTLEPGSYTLTITYANGGIKNDKYNGYIKNIQILRTSCPLVATQKNGIGASTTGNIYGIYDVAGGSNDYVAAKYVDNIEDVTDEDKKYYDIYTSYDINTACGGVCYGHALSETANWQDNATEFLTSEQILLTRGGQAEHSGTGIFAYNSVKNSIGDTEKYPAIRLVITN